MISTEIDGQTPERLGFIIDKKSLSSALSEKIKIKVILCHRLFADSGNSWRVFSLWLGSSDTEALPSNSLGMPGG
jgi:hypothetical protein